MKSWEIACHTSSPEGTAEYYLRPHRYWVSVVPSGLDHVFKPTQDFILGYSQPSLRDSRGVFPQPARGRQEHRMGLQACGFSITGGVVGRPGPVRTSMGLILERGSGPEL